MGNVSKGFNSYSKEFLEENRRFQALEKRLVRKATVLDGAIYYHYNTDGSFAGLSQTPPLEEEYFGQRRDLKRKRDEEEKRKQNQANTTTNEGTATANTTTNGDTATANTTTNGDTATANTTTNGGTGTVNGTEPPALKKNKVNPPPTTGEKPKGKTKVPPISIQHAECGHLTFGDEKDKETGRPRDVGLYGGDSQKLRLFRDGGFELCSSESQGVNKIKGSLINQVCNNGFLTINSEGDIKIRAKNKLTLEADLIEIRSTNASEDGITMLAEHDIKIRANNNTIITSDNITIDAKERIVSHSEGWQILIGQCIRLHEPQTKICPAFMREYIDGQIKTLKN